MEIKLSQFASATETKYVIIGYEAELRSTAEADTTYKNTEYSQYSKYKTEPTSVNVQTFDVKFKKVDSTSNALLDGAFFELRKDAENGTPVKFIANTFYSDEKYSSKALDTTSSYKAASATAKVADTRDVNFTTKLAAGELRISGLGAGKYYLVETSAPKGYNMLEKSIEITIGTGGEQTIKYSGETDATKYLVNGKTRQTYDEFPVVNTAGTALPSTGGMGTTVLYIVGGMLVILAGAYLFFSRKRTA